MPRDGDETTTTRKRDLRTGDPVWAGSPHSTLRRRRRLPSERYDVAIVGAGISGALVAHALADGERRLLMVDRRPPLCGSTLASTALLQHEIDVPLEALGRAIGRAPAARAWRRSARAVEELAALVREAGIACGLSARSALYLAGDELGGRALRSEAEARRAAGLEAEFLDAAALRARFGLEREAAILGRPAAAANPAQLAAGLIRLAQGRGLTLVSPLEIADVLPVGDAVALATADGRLVSAGAAVFCTGYEFLERLASRRHDVLSTWAVAVRAKGRLPAWLRRTLVWEASDPYLYLRTARDGSLIAGGEDEEGPGVHDDGARLARKAATIAGKLEALLGLELQEPHHAWAGAFGTTSTGLPLIGAVPGLDRVYAAMGFGGNGITFSKIAADVIAAELAGRPDPDADLFAFPRE